ERPPVAVDLTGVRSVKAGEDVRERALARAVLAEQRVHLPRRRLEVDAVVRDDAGELLRDAARDDRRRRRGAVGAPPVKLQLRGDVPHTYLPVGLPITPFTSQFIEYRSCTVIRLPFATPSLPC